MVNNRTGQVKVIDPEFTVYAPAGLDVGSLLSGFVLAAVHHAFDPTTDAAVKTSRINAIHTAATTVWVAYAKALEEGGLSPAVVKASGVEAVGFAVAEVCRTALGFAGGRKWLQFEDPGVKAESCACALRLVQKCMIRRHGALGGMALLLREVEALSTQAAAAPFVVVVQVEIAPSRLEAFLSAMKVDAEGSRTEPGCLRFDVLKVAGSDTKFVFYEAYVDAAALTFHKEQPHFAAWASFKAVEGSVLSQEVQVTGGTLFHY